MKERLSRRALSITTAALLGVVGLNACNSGKDSEGKKECLSPKALSNTYPGDPKVTSLDRSAWRLGVVATTSIPKDPADKALIAGYRSPGGTWHTSKPIPLQDGAHVAWKIGPGSLQVRLQVQAEDGSELCKRVLPTMFSAEKDLDAINAIPDVLYPSWAN